MKLALTSLLQQGLALSISAGGKGRWIEEPLIGGILTSSAALGPEVTQPPSAQAAWPEFWNCSHSEPGTEGSCYPPSSCWP